MNVSKLLEKVAHLRALAARAGTQAEAEAAASAADKILVEHQLSEAEVPDPNEERIEKHTAPLDTWEGNRETWRAELAHVLAKHYGCYTYSHYLHRQGTLPIFGRRSDVEIVRYMYSWLTLEITRLSERERGKAARNGFRRGAVIGYRNALYRSKKEAETTHAGSVALVIVERAKLAEETARNTTEGLRSCGKTRLADYDALLRGREAGEGLGRNALPQGVKGLLK